MSKELVIGLNRHETKVAVLEEDQLVEVFFQRANEYSLAGSIHKGRVTRVLAGMQSAFVDIGLERDAFLYVSDFFEEHDDIDTVSDEKPQRVERTERRDRGGRGFDRRGQGRGQQRQAAGPQMDRGAIFAPTEDRAEADATSAPELEVQGIEPDDAFEPDAYNPVEDDVEFAEPEADEAPAAAAIVALAPPSPDLAD